MGRIAEYQRRNLASAVVGVPEQDRSMETAGKYMTAIGDQMIQVDKAKRDASEALQAEAAYTQYQIGAARLRGSVQRSSASDPSSYPTKLQQNLTLLKDKYLEGIDNPRVKEQAQQMFTKHISAEAGQAGNWMNKAIIDNAEAAEDNAAIQIKTTMDSADENSEDPFAAFTDAGMQLVATRINPNTAKLRGTEQSKQIVTKELDDSMRAHLTARAAGDAPRLLADLDAGKYDKIAFTADGETVEVTLGDAEKEAFRDAATKNIIEAVNEDAMRTVASVIPKLPREQSVKVMSGEWTAEDTAAESAKIQAYSPLNTTPEQAKEAYMLRDKMVQNVQARQVLSDIFAKKRFESADVVESARITAAVMQDLTQLVYKDLRYTRQTVKKGKTKPDKMKKPKSQQANELFDTLNTVNRYAAEGKLTKADWGTINSTLSPAVMEAITQGAGSGKMPAYANKLTEIKNAVDSGAMFRGMDTDEKARFAVDLFSEYTREWEKMGDTDVSSNSAFDMAKQTVMTKYFPYYTPMKEGDVYTRPDGSSMKVGSWSWHSGPKPSQETVDKKVTGR